MELASGPVVTCKAVDAGLDEYEAKFRIFVCTIAFHVFSDGHGLLYEHVEVLWDLWGKTILLQKT